MKPAILILAYTPLARDPRVYRQVLALRSDHDLTVVGYGSPPDKGVEGVEFLSLRQEAAWGWRQRIVAGLAMPLGGADLRPHIAHIHRSEDLARLAGRRFSAIIVNDLEPLPFAFSIAGTTPVIWDAHEYYLDDHRPTWKSRFLLLPHIRRLCRTWIPRCAAVTTVGEGIAQRYAKEFGVAPQLVLNAPAFVELEPRLGVGSPVRIVHHGGMAASRSFDLLIEAMRILGPSHHLDLMLVPVAGRPWERLVASVRSAGNVALVPPVPMPEIPRELNSRYDLGIHVLPPVSFNDRMALPNKFFEFIQARLGLVVGPSPEMAGLVERHGIGAVARDFTPAAIAEAVRSLDSMRIDGCKRQSHGCARIYHAGAAQDAIRSVVARVLAMAGTSG